MHAFVRYVNLHCTDGQLVVKSWHQTVWKMQNASRYHPWYWPRGHLSGTEASRSWSRGSMYQFGADGDRYGIPSRR